MVDGIKQFRANDFMAGMKHMQGFTSRRTPRWSTNRIREEIGEGDTALNLLLPLPAVDISAVACQMLKLILQCLYSLPSFVSGNCW